MPFFLCQCVVRFKLLTLLTALKTPKIPIFVLIILAIITKNYKKDTPTSHEFLNEERIETCQWKLRRKKYELKVDAKSLSWPFEQYVD